MKVISLLMVVIFLLDIGNQQATVMAQEKPSRAIITGTIKDNTGAPLPGVTVQVPALHVGVTTDTSGTYHLVVPVTGSYTLTIAALGFKSISSDISLPGKYDFTMLPQAGTLQEVIITGVSQGMIISKMPAAVAVVTKREMDMNTNNNAIDAVMKSVPGVTAVTTGPNVSKPFIRGLGYNRVLTLYDGIRQEGQQWGDEHGIEIDQYAIGRVEVVKGPASLTYGSDALAGVINMLPVDINGPQGKLLGDVMIDYHTNNGLAAISTGLGFKKNDWKYNFRLSGKTAHSYLNKVDGFVYGTAFHELDASGIVSLDKLWGNIKIGATLFTNKQEIPDGSRDSATRKFTYQVLDEGDDITNRPIVPDNKLKSYTINPLHQQIQYYRLYTSNQLHIGKGNLFSTFAVQQSIRQEFNHPTMTLQPGLDVKLNTVSYSLKYNFPELNGFQIAVGSNGMYQKNKSINGSDFPIPDYHFFDMGGFLFANKSIGKLNLSGGLRYDNRHLSWDNFYIAVNPATGFDQHVKGSDGNARLQFPVFQKTYTGFSGSVGMTYNIGQKWVLKANIAGGYRAPNITEVGANGLDPGAHIVYLGNRSFKPEFSLQEDFGILGYLKDVDIMLELFNNNLENYIYQSRLLDANGQPVIIVPGNYTYQYQQNKARLYGFEVACNLHPSGLAWLSWNNALSYIQGLNKSETLKNQYGDAAKYLPFMPPLNMRSEVRGMADNTWGRLSKSFLKVECAYNWKQSHFYAADNTETYTPGYTLINAGCGTTIVNKDHKTLLNIYLGVENVFDVAYQSHLNRLKYFEYYTHSPNGFYGIYNMGRNMSVKLSAPF
jgi:iron complex outermembrane receptor protein